MEKMTANRWFKSVQIHENSEDKVIVGEFDICSDKPHGRVIITTNNYFEFSLMNQGEI